MNVYAGHDSIWIGEGRDNMYHFGARRATASMCRPEHGVEWREPVCTVVELFSALKLLQEKKA